MERLLEPGSKRPRIRRIWSQFRDWQAHTPHDARREAVNGGTLPPDAPEAAGLIFATTTPAERALVGWKFPYPSVDELRARTPEERDRIGRDATVLFSRYLHPETPEVPDAGLDVGSYVGRHQDRLLGSESPLTDREKTVMVGLFGAGGRDRVSTRAEIACEIGRSVSTVRRAEGTLMRKLSAMQQG